MSRNSVLRGILTVAVVLLVVGTSLTAGASLGSTATADARDDEGAMLSATDTDGQNVSISNVSFPDYVRIGEGYTVTATVRNEGDFTVRRLTYRVLGTVVAAKFVELPAGTATTVTFELDARSVGGFPSGSYTHGVFTRDARATANLTLAADDGTTAAERTTDTAEPAEETRTPTAGGDQATTQTATTAAGTETASEVTDAPASRTVRVDVRVEDGALTVTAVGGPSDAELILVRDGELDWEGLQTLAELLLDSQRPQNATNASGDGE